MRLWAAAAFLVLSSCATPPYDPVLPEYRIEWTTPSGERFASASGDIEFSPVSRACWTNESFRIVNVGLATGRFRLSAASAQFSYEEGPFELAPAQFIDVPVRLIANGNETSAKHELRIEPDTLAPLTFTFKFGIADASIDLPSYDFKAVLVGQEAALLAPDVNDLTGDFRKDGAEIFFRPSTVGAQFVTANYAYQANCEPGRISVRGDGVADWVQLLAPVAVSFDGTRVGGTSERLVSLDLWLDEELPFEVSQAPAGAPSVVFTAEDIP